MIVALMILMTIIYRTAGIPNIKDDYYFNDTKINNMIFKSIR